MKLIITRYNLKEVLDSVSKICGDNLNLPILKNILIKINKGKIDFSSTDLELAITYNISGKIIEEGEITIPALTFSSIINNLNSEIINIETEKDKLIIKTDNYKAIILGLNTEEFPIIPQIKNINNFIELKSEVLKKILIKVSSAVGVSELRLEINGIFMNFEINSIKFVGTDSFRLAEKTLNIIDFKTNFNEGFKIIIPLKAIQELLRILKDGENLRIYLDDNQILFKTERWELISRLIEGEFPNYQSIIPSSIETEIVLNKNEFINALKLTSIFSTKINEVKIKISDNKKFLEIFSLNQNIGDNKYMVPAKIKGESTEVGFNWNYLLSGLKVFEEEEIFFGINKNEKPAIIKSLLNPSYFYILMPIRE